MALLLPDMCEFLEIGRQFFFFLLFFSVLFPLPLFFFFFFYATRIKIPSLSKHFLFLYL